VDGAGRLPTDDFRKSVPVSIYGRRQRDGSDAGVDNTGNEKSQGHCCRFVALLLSSGTVVKSFVFGGLPEPNRACLVGVYAFLILNNLCDLVYQTPTKSYQSQIPVAFGIPAHVTTKHLPDTPC